MAAESKASAKMSPEQLEEYKQAFSVFDKDGSGSITSVELESVMKSLGQNPTKEELDAMVQEVDADGNDEIDFDEFCDLMMRKAAEGSNDDAELREAFQIFDTKDHGYITLMDLKNVMISLGEKLSDAELEDMIKEADANNDGKIQFEEFVRMMTDKW
ncbi:calmodulin, striated muscle-like [Lineus longissimus]|uniref:calmodulin, striated muscle-like n=1 Tax=Lineus longissimus TaxID=88925 RepID=UPI002B4F6ADE